MRSALASLGFGVGFAAAWFVMGVIALPLLWYLPLERRFTFATTVTTLGMDLYGRLLLASCVGAAFAAVGAALATRASARWLVHGAIWVGTLVALGFSLQLAALATRHPTPLEGTRP